MLRIFRMFICAVVVFSFIMPTVTTFAATSSKPISIQVNTVSIKVNGKTVKIDNFSYANNTYIQPQDISNLFNLEYVYNTKSKTIIMTTQKPIKPVQAAKAKFLSYKTMTMKSVGFTANSVSIKVDGKTMKSGNLSYDGAIFVAAKELSDLLGKDFILDVVTKTITINDKKPTKPTLTPDTTLQTGGDVKVTIGNWGSANIKEYKIGNGPWLKYTLPVVLTSKATVFARGTNAVGIVSDVGSLDVNNIHKLLSKVEVSKNSDSTVKVVFYDINHVELGNGSGFIISSDGKIVTNYHVVDMVTTIEVLTKDNKTYKVSGVTAFDSKRDLAVLKLENSDSLPSVYLGNSDEINLGEDVVAIGYPLGVSNTVSFGNISSLNIPGGSRRKDYKDIQTTAAISPGSSGGPLFNMYGEVVGINYSTIVNGQNMNFAIPINELKPLLSANQLMSLSDVIKEVYPIMDYSQYASYLYCNYPDYKTEKYTFSFTDVSVEEYSKDPNEVDVVLGLNTKKYAEILLADTEGNRKEVEKWAEDVYSKVKTLFPNKSIYIYIALSTSFTSRPEGYTDKETWYDSDTKLWDVFKLKMVYGYQNNLPDAVWMP